MSQIWDKKWNTKLGEIQYYIDENQEVVLSRHSQPFCQVKWKDMIDDKSDKFQGTLNSPIYHIKAVGNILKIDLV